MARENAEKYEKSQEFWDDPLLDAYLNDLVQRLAKVAHPRPFTYRIKVAKDASLNAFTFGAGYLYVRAGLLARMENEAQLVMVLGHEMAHVTQSHVTKGIEGTYGIQLLGQIAASAASASGKTAQIPLRCIQATYRGCRGIGLKVVPCCFALLLLHANAIRGYLCEGRNVIGNFVVTNTLPCFIMHSVQNGLIVSRHTGFELDAASFGCLAASPTRRDSSPPWQASRNFDWLKQNDNPHR